MMTGGAPIARNTRIADHDQSIMKQLSINDSRALSMINRYQLSTSALFFDVEELAEASAARSWE